MKKRLVVWEVNSVLNIMVQLQVARWQLITTIKHPNMDGCEHPVKRTVEKAVEVRRSRSDHMVYLYYSPVGDRYCCAVVRHDNGHGFVVTAYVTDKIKEGDSIWKK